MLQSILKSNFKFFRRLGTAKRENQTQKTVDVGSILSNNIVGWMKSTVKAK